jgi:hypothetical protein
MPEPTERQTLRQRERSYTSGRYDSYGECGVVGCTKKLPPNGDYYSVAGFENRGLHAVCLRCVTKLSKLSPAEIEPYAPW